MVSITARGVPLMANAVGLAASRIDADGLREGMEVRIAGGAIAVGQLTDRLGRPGLGPGRAVRSPRRRTSRRCRTRRASRSRATAAGARGLALLRAALAERDPAGAGEAAGALLGRGPGLTPEGDDLLAGAAIGSTRWGRRSLAGALCPPDVEARTTALSATLLRLAAGGAAPEPMLRVIAGDDPEGRSPTCSAWGARPAGRSPRASASAARAPPRPLNEEARVEGVDPGLVDALRRGAPGPRGPARAGYMERRPNRRRSTARVTYPVGWLANRRSRRRLRPVPDPHSRSSVVVDVRPTKERVAERPSAQPQPSSTSVDEAGRHDAVPDGAMATRSAAPARTSPATKTRGGPPPAGRVPGRPGRSRAGRSAAARHGRPAGEVAGEGAGVGLSDPDLLARVPVDEVDPPARAVFSTPGPGNSSGDDPRRGHACREGDAGHHPALAREGPADLRRYLRRPTRSTTPRSGPTARPTAPSSTASRRWATTGSPRTTRGRRTPGPRAAGTRVRPPAGWTSRATPRTSSTSGPGTRRLRPVQDDQARAGPGHRPQAGLSGGAAASAGRRPRRRARAARAARAIVMTT